MFTCLETAKEFGKESEDVRGEWLLDQKAHEENVKSVWRGGSE